MRNAKASLLILLALLPLALLRLACVRASENARNSVVRVPQTQPAVAVIGDGKPPLAILPTSEPSEISRDPAGANAQTRAVGDPTALYIDQQQVWFPKAILRLTTVDNQLQARLSTDDPPAAIEDNYTGNSFDILMPLNVADVQHLDGANWSHHSASEERQEDSPHGIFLNGQKQRLHADEMIATFSRAKNGASGDTWIVVLRGYYLLYDNPGSERSLAPPRRVLVQGRIVATLTDK